MSETASNIDVSAAPALEVNLIGPMQIRRRGGEVVELPRKVRALFAYLVTRRGTTVPRQTLLGLFWGDRSEAQARSSLRQALNILRTTLDDLADDILVATGEAVAIKEENVLTDLDRLDRTGEMVEDGPGIGSLEFLEGLALGESAFENWLAEERERVRAKILQHLKALAATDETDGRIDLAASRVAAVLRQVPTDEEAHRQMMRLHLLRSRTDEAIRQFEKCRTALRDLLDVEPEGATVDLWEEAKQIRRKAAGGHRTGEDERKAAAPYLVSFTSDAKAESIVAALANRGGIPLDEETSNTTLAFEDASEALRACVEARTQLRHLAGADGPVAAFALHFGEDDEPGAGYGSIDLARLKAILVRTGPGEIHASSRFFKAVRRNSPYFFEGVYKREEHEQSPVFRVTRAMQRQPSLAIYENQAPRRAKRPCSLAVAPIKHMGPEGTSDDFWSDGLTEDLILELSRTHRLDVSSRTTLFAIRSHDAVEIGQELGVGYVLSGSFRKLGQSARLNFALAETDRGSVIWTERFDADIERIFDVIDEIVAKVVARITGTIERSETETARSKRPENMTAYEYYLRGVWHHRMGGVTSDHSRKAVEWLSKAIEADPNFQRPKAMLCCAWSDLPDYDEARADSTVVEAYEADPTDPETNRIMAYIKFKMGEYDAGVRHADRSVELAPHDAYLLGRCAAIHIFNGDPATGLARLNRAVELDPFVPVYIIEERLSAYYLMGDHEKVISEARDLHHQTRRSRYYTAASLVALDRIDAARIVMQMALADDPSLCLDYLRSQELYRDPKIMAQLEERAICAGLPG